MVIQKMIKSLDIGSGIFDRFQSPRKNEIAAARTLLAKWSKKQFYVENYY